MFPKTNQLGLHFGSIKNAEEVDYRLDSPFIRSIPLQTVMLVVVVGMSWIGLTSILDAVDTWRDVDRLFILTAALFQTFWSIGWTFATLIISLICFAIAFGRLVVLVHSGKIEFIIGVPGLGGRLSANAHDVNKVSLVPHSKSSLFADAGMQLKIHTDGDHDNSPIGSDMTQADVDKLWSAIERNRHIVSDLDGKLDRGSAVDEGSATDEHGSMPLNAASYPPPIDNRHHADDSVSLTSPSTIMLVLANLVPIFGVLYLGWDLGSTMVLFWAETGIILLYTVLKGIAEHKALGLILGLVLISHAGAFMAIHFLFIWTIFVEGLSSVKQPFSTSNLSQVADYLKSLWPALVALLVSHGYSFKHNFLDKRARHLSHQEEDASDKQQNSIYSRITLMHLTIIIGGGIAMLLGRGELSLVLLIVMKLIVDIRAHIKQHDN